MTTKIIIKNSSVPDKEPDAGALEVGELAINLADKKLYSKDTGDTVFEIGAAGAVPGGETDDRPSSPNAGDLFYDTDLDALLYWNGSSWEVVGAVTSVNGQTGDVTIDIPSQTSDLTNDGDGTSPFITTAGVNDILDGTTGGDVFLKAGDNVSELSNDAGYLTSATLPPGAGLWTEGTNQIYPAAAGNSVLIGGVLPSAPNITLNAAGSAEFAGDVVVNNEYNVGSGVHSFNNGSIFIRRDGAGSSTRMLSLLNGGTASGNQVANIYGDGSATFAGTVDVNRLNAGSTTHTTPAFTATNGHATEPAAYVRNNIDSGPAIIVAGGPGTPNATINADGSASFAGNVVSFGDPNNGANRGARLGNGSVMAGNTQDNFTVFEGYKVGTAAPTSTILADGSAKFAGQLNSGNDTFAGYAAIFNSRIASSGSVATVYIRNHDSTGRLIWCAKHDDQNTSVFKVESDGSAEFAGKVTANSFDLESLQPLP